MEHARAPELLKRICFVLALGSQLAPNAHAQVGGDPWPDPERRSVPTSPAPEDESSGLPAAQPEAIPIPAPSPGAGLASPTDLRAMFERYVRDPMDARGVEQAAARLVAEIFNESDEVEAKLWELQALVRSFVDDGGYDAQASQRVRVLEAGLGAAAYDHRFWSQVGDVGTIVAVSAALATLRGFGVTPEAVWPYARGGAQAVGRAGAWSFNALRGALSLETYRAAGRKVREGFRAVFRRLTSAEKLARDLRALGLTESDVEAATRGLTVPDANRVAKLQFFKTNRRKLDFVPVRFAVARGQDAGYMIFRTRRNQGAWRRSTYEYARSEDLTEEQLGRFLANLYRGRDRRIFANVVTEDGGTVETRMAVSTRVFVSSRGQADFRVVDVEPEEVVRRRWLSFEAQPAGWTFVSSTGLFTAGYLLAQGSDRVLANVYLESLVRPEDLVNLQDSRSSNASWPDGEPRRRGRSTE